VENRKSHCSHGLASSQAQVAGPTAHGLAPPGETGEARSKAVSAPVAGQSGGNCRQGGAGWWLEREGSVGELIVGWREDGDSPTTALHGGMSFTSEKSSGGVGRGSGRPAPGPRSNAG
jgi:hypothetical protein